MLLTLLAHQWKQARRSSVFQKGLALNIILGFFILYFSVCFLALGLFMGPLLRELYPGQNPVAAFNGFLLFYFLLDLFMRFMLQELPVLSIQPYLHLPVPKQKLIHYVLLASLPSVFNLIMLLIFVPFLVTTVAPMYGAGVAGVWLATLLLLTFFNNFLLLYFKRQLSNNPKWTLAFGLVVVGLMVLDYTGVLSLRQVSTAMFGYVLQQPWLVVVPVLLLTGAYLLNYFFLKAHTYPEELAVRKAGSVEGSDMAFLNRFGETGKLIALELKLIWRHKRPKSVLMMSAVFLFYGLIFYTKPMFLERNVMLIFVGIFMTGIPMFQYGQFVPGWQSSHFDGLLTTRISPYQFYLAKFWIFVPTLLLMFLLTLPYGLFGYKVVLVNLAAFLFNIGVNSFIVLYFTVYNKSRLDLSKGAAFNWQGVGASKFLVQLPLLLLPLLLYAPFGFMDMPYLGIGLLGVAGVVGFIFHRQLLQVIAHRFLKHKYTMAAGFRVA
ncbi:DUF5687 family protein [Pontibacter chitinilyticus]|uniref:DUF5687 family protein n=1 Tax=Pontibacter chitinilyticus TaxID=2674989 RepID=UPI00321AF1BF